MAPKRATYLSYGNNELCADTVKYIQDAGVLLEIRDLEKNPMSVDELSRFIGYLDLSHFLNKSSDSYAKIGLKDGKLDRAEAYEWMAKDHTLIRRPIIRWQRLITIGCDKKKISEMLQIQNGRVITAEPVSERIGNVRNNKSRRHASSASR